MNFEEALYHARVGGAVAFLGSGFSHGAKNINNSDIPSVRDLSAIFAKDLNESADEDLMLLADMFERVRGRSALENLLKESFTTKIVSQSHKRIISCPWRRIYSTNYDDVAEVSANQSEIKLISLSLSDRPDKQSSSAKMIVHLHGSIRDEHLPTNSDLQLSISSYTNSKFSSSPWSPTLRQDFQFAKAVFFIGYSIKDIEIARLIGDSTLISSKIFIITAPNIKNIERSYLERFGEVLDIGVEGLAENLSAIEISAVDHAPLTLTSFERFAVPSTSRKATQDDYVSLLTKGTFSPELFSQTTDLNSPYATPRTAVKSLRARDETGRVLIHSGLGNGKSVLVQELMQDFASRGFDVYNFIRPGSNISSEIDEILKNDGRKCFIFDDFFRSRDIVRYASTHVTKTDIIICTCKTLQRELDNAEIISAIGNDYIEYDLNHLSQAEISHAVDAFNAYGLWGANNSLPPDRKSRIFHEDCSSEMRSIVLYAFRSNSVSNKLHIWADGIKNSGRESHTFILAAILCSLVHGRLSHLDIIELLSLDDKKVREQLSNNDASDLVNLKGPEVGIKSAILSEYIIQEAFEPDSVLDTLVEMITRLTQWIGAGTYITDVLRDLMRFALVGRLFESDSRRDFIVSFYERLRSNEYCRSNPQFWLQFAMARMDRGEYNLADTLLGMAESKASQRQHYNSFQIENQRAKFILISRSESDLFDDYQSAYTKAASITNKQLDGAKAKADPYPLRLISAHEKFIAVRGTHLDERGLGLALSIANRFEERLKSWPELDYRVERIGWVESIRKIKDTLLNLKT